MKNKKSFFYKIYVVLFNKWTCEEDFKEMFMDCLKEKSTRPTLQLFSFVSLLVAYAVSLTVRATINSYIRSRSRAISFLSEDLQAIFEDLEKRWVRQGKSRREIQYLTFKHLFHMLIGDWLTKIQDLWIFNKEVEK